MTSIEQIPPTSLGTAGPIVSRLCLGTSSWARAANPLDPVELLDQVFVGEGSGERVRYIDTANEYSGGLSETLIGDAIHQHGGLPEGLVIQTKLDRDVRTGDFSSDRMWRSLEESLGRLHLDSLPMLFLHDPEHIGFEKAMANDGPVTALVEMKRSGVAERIGISGGPVGLLEKFVGTDLFDAVITHNRYTLVDRSAQALVNASRARGVAVLNAAVYGGGALAKWPVPATTYAYVPIRAEVAAAISAMGEACSRLDIPLAAAALQWSTRNPAITSSIFGVASSAQLGATVALDAVSIPSSLWEELEELVPPAESWIGASR
ncbi:MAG TPA: aldo/keto reductase [Lacisediminihabitans sp.]|uniref:aldo/keto reductase n=1 Tax=Lacisediminihabitans sp. TaxID=2787631 RepID=UPI002ED8F806